MIPIWICVLVGFFAMRGLDSAPTNSTAAANGTTVSNQTLLTTKLESDKSDCRMWLKTNKSESDDCGDVWPTPSPNAVGAGQLVKSEVGEQEREEEQDVPSGGGDAEGQGQVPLKIPNFGLSGGNGKGTVIGQVVGIVQNAVMVAAFDVLKSLFG